MTNETIFANARVILEREVVLGSVRIQDGAITDIDTGGHVATGALDMGGDFIAPGLVELHTDNLERHLTPRPKVDWPQRPAILAHDCELAATGITTVFDAIRVGSVVSNDAKRYNRYARKMADEILAMRTAGALRVRHHIHLRAEVCSETLLDELDEFGPDDRIGIVSMMDHTPGQRQFSDMKKYKDYVCGKHGLDANRFDEYVAFLRGVQTEFGPKHEQAVVAAATRYGATLASHDDTTSAQVTASAAHGVIIAEFPTTLEAAQACQDRKIVTVMGAPNLIRGASHSGNVAALELAKRGQLDILSSDYVPAGLLGGAVQLGQLWGDVPRGIATVTSAPARAVGLNNRGVLRVGASGDLIRFAMVGDVPALKETWCRGVRVF
ncbi:MAG: alpha-D-ribose 1-methylphosphonate 5-triphosphate diphosphatase [Ascidiaceihabitans sp.]|jgi:alpha-D-ribose 1-methylphosphonate 5-triphosphate diphosphatase